MLPRCPSRGLGEVPLDGPASTRPPCLGSRLPRASEGLTQAKQAIHVCVDAGAIWLSADTHCGSILCSLWPSTPPTEPCRCVRPPPSAAADNASTNRADCVVVCGARHRDHDAVPASAEWSVAPLPAAWTPSCTQRFSVVYTVCLLTLRQWQTSKREMKLLVL